MPPCLSEVFALCLGSGLLWLGEHGALVCVTLVWILSHLRVKATILHIWSCRFELNSHMHSWKNSFDHIYIRMPVVSVVSNRIRYMVSVQKSVYWKAWQSLAYKSSGFILGCGWMAFVSVCGSYLLTRSLSCVNLTFSCSSVIYCGSLVSNIECLLNQYWISGQKCSPSDHHTTLLVYIW